MLLKLTNKCVSPQAARQKYQFSAVCVFLLLLLFAQNSNALVITKGFPNAGVFFKNADSFGEFSGSPPSAPVFKQQQIIGYIFLSKDVTPIPAYSGLPINMLVGIDLQGFITAIKVIEHHEPILLVGIPQSRLDDFVNQYIGRKLNDNIKVGSSRSNNGNIVDAITGATVTVMVVNETIKRAARKVAVSRGIIKKSTKFKRLPATIRTNFFEQTNWQKLINNGAIVQLYLNNKKVNEAFNNGRRKKFSNLATENNNETFIDISFTYLNAPTIGRNLLGDDEFKWLLSTLKPGDHAIAVMANGEYSFKGSGYVRGGIFDRIQIQQSGQEISFRDSDYFRLNDVYLTGIPKFHEMAIFIIRAINDFDPGAAWKLNLLVKRQTGPLTSDFVNFEQQYQMPQSYYIQAKQPATSDEEIPMWLSIWLERQFQIAILLFGLGLLMIIMWLQDWLVRFPLLIVSLRRGFQFYSIFFIGWYLLGQLSIVNVFAFSRSLFKNFSWDTFMIDPTLFLLWSFVAGSLLFWGRGVYCGWLCPFGALQKSINEIARWLKIPQFNLPQIVHDRLWGIKYLILLVLFAISLQSLGTAERYAEIEPFKTAITLHFNRELPFIIYAVALLVISLFNCKFYCKYLCPLGAALAIPARLRMVDWLRRRSECGNPCQACASECEIQAIDDTGKINPNECHYCLDCQVTYWDDHKCPPLVERRKKRERIKARYSTKKSIPVKINTN